MDITTVVIPVAGAGSRMLPATSAIEKCLLPIYAAGTCRPLIDYVVEDCVRAGVQRIIFVTTLRGREQLRDYFGHDIPSTLLKQLQRLHKSEIIDADRARRQAYGLTYDYIIQPEHEYGTAVPLSLARRLLAGEKSFALVSSDDFIHNADGSSELGRAIAGWKSTDTDYGLMAAPLAPAPEGNVIHFDKAGHFASVEDGCPQERWPDTPLTNTSRYLLRDTIWPFAAAEMQRNVGNGEHLIIDVFAAAVAAGRSFMVHTVAGTYLDGGRPDKILEACNYIDAHPPIVT